MKAHDMPFFFEQTGQIDQLVIVDAFHYDRVDLDRPEASSGGSVDTFEHWSNRSAETVDASIDLVVERLDADGHAIESSVGEDLRLFGEQESRWW